jgi:hypothetical protein
MNMNRAWGRLEMHIKCHEQISKINTSRNHYSMEQLTHYSNVKEKLSLCFFNRAPLHEGVLGEQRYGSTHSWPRH